jgi:hypothetical protein
MSGSLPPRLQISEGPVWGTCGFGWRPTQPNDSDDSEVDHAEQ